MRTVDLFAGCGGLSKGFQNAEFNIVAAFEYWSVAATCYENNFNHPVYQTDLSQTDDAIGIIEKLNPTVIIGGPPCQDFSHAGKRIEANRASLTSSFAKIVSTVQPKYFVMENVDRAQKSLAYQEARAVFKQAGYGLTEIVLDASLCGVPQKRKRFFCVGVLNAEDNCALAELKQEMSETPMTLKDYFGNTLDFEYYYRHPRNYNRRGVFSVDEPAPTMRGVNRPVPKGYPGHPKDACAVSSGVRALTTLERALIQTFPADFKWLGTKTDTEQMIGNAVPVRLAEYVANALLLYVHNENQLTKTKDEFIFWLLTQKQYSLRSANDVLSRIKRADRFHPIATRPDTRYIFELERTSDFSNLSAPVKSQLKRATVLYNEFLGM